MTQSYDLLIKLIDEQLILGFQEINKSSGLEQAKIKIYYIIYGILNKMPDTEIPEELKDRIHENLVTLFKLFLRGYFL